MRRVKTILASCLVSLAPVMGLAENITLNFRFVTIDTDIATQTIEAVEDLSFEAVKSVGVAFFEDGRVATKKYVWVSSSTDWVTHGRSAYTFENGDTIVARFLSQPVGEGFVGEYEVMSGTGAYEGATGTGRFEMQDVNWENEGLWTGQLELKLP